MPNLIGTAPDQVPTNGSLGNMAFQNKEGVVTDLLSTTALTVTGTGPLTVGGTQIVKDASGNVGIGTAPDEKLVVRGNIRINGVSDNHTAGIRSDGTNAYFDNFANAPIIFRNNNYTERMRIAGTGNVGIGVSSPSFRLQVETDTDANTGVFVRNSNTGTAASGVVSVNSLVGGIGIRAHSAAHTVWPNSSLIQSDSGFTGGLNILQAGANPIRFWTNGSERMRIDSAGKVGIGTTAPTNILTIAGAIEFSASAFTGTGTGIWLPAPNELGFVTAGSTNMRLDSGGNLGIGTSAPSARLHLHSTAGGGDLPRMRFTNGGTGTAPTDGMFVGISNTSQLDIWNFENDAVRVGTNNAERMRISAAGDVGVGVAPSAWGSTYRALEVRTGAVYDTPAGTSSGFAFNAYFNGTNWLYKGTGGNATALRYEQGGAGHQWFSAPSGAGGATISFTNTMVLNPSGNVGIGTGLPLTRLHVSQSNASDYASVVLLSNSANAAADRTGIYGSPASGTANPYRGGITFWPGSSGAVSIHVGNNATPGAGEAMRIDGTNGNVGIGTTSPGAKLDVDGQIFVRNANGIATDRVAPYSGLGLSLVAGSSPMLFTVNSAERMRISANGWVGIGRTAQGVFDVHNGGNGTVSYFYGGGSIVYSDIDTHVFRRAAGAESVRIDSNGNLLVGTTVASALGTQSKFKTNGTSGASASIGSVSGNTTGAIDTLIPINQSSFGGTALLLASRNTGSGTATDSAVYLVRFYYDGNNAPTKTLIAGTDFVTFGVSGSQTLTLTNASGGNVSYAWFGNK